MSLKNFGSAAVDGVAGFAGRRWVAAILAIVIVVVPWVALGVAMIINSRLQVFAWVIAGVLYARSISRSLRRREKYKIAATAVMLLSIYVASYGWKHDIRWMFVLAPIVWAFGVVLREHHSQNVR